MEKHFYAIGKTYMVRKILQPGNTYMAGILVSSRQRLHPLQGLQQ